MKNTYSCNYCNKSFERYCKHVNGNTHFCSIRCKADYQKGKHFGKPKNGIYKICPKCKKQFYVPRSDIVRRVHCSNSCAKIGIRPWNYIHGLGKTRRRYGVYWDVHRLKIIERDNSICQVCGKIGNHVDHIIPFRISKDNSFSNLQVLCVSCHGKKTNWEMKYYG